MDVVLTSFGMGMKERGHRSIFHRLPPLFTGNETGRFHIDYAALFMFDRVIVDERSYEKAVSAEIADDEVRWMTPMMLEAVRKGAAEYAQVLTSLHQSGRVVTKNFDQVLANSGNLLEQTTSKDMKDICRWRLPLESALNEWTLVTEQMRGRYRRVHEEGHEKEDEAQRTLLAMTAHRLANDAGAIYQLLHVLKRWKKKQSPTMREMCRELLSDYLYYTNFNLILSFDCQAPFVDWMDMRHFYEEKFRNVTMRQEDVADGQQVAAQTKQLFDFLFPYFVPRSPTELLRGLEDSRAERLRQFVKAAVEKGTRFDSKECIHILKDILRLEQKAIFRRKITGWATLPVGFVPLFGTPIQKGLEELINSLWANRPSHEYSWFYLINELDVSVENE